MAVIGSLAVNIIAKLNPFAKGMSDARRHVHGFRRDAAMLGASLAGVAKAAVLAGGSYGIGRFIKSSVTAMDELGELSDRIGINVGELQGLRHAAKLSGTDIDSLTTGLERLNVFVGKSMEIAGGPEARLLRKLGLDPRELANLPREQQFSAISDGLNSIENSSLRASRAQQIFGRGAGSFKNMIDLGSAGLKGMSDEFDKLHGKMTDEQKAKVSAFADAMDKLGTAMGGIGQSFVISISDPAIKAINQLVTLAADFRRGLSFLKEVASNTKIGGIADFNRGKEFVSEQGKGIWNDPLGWMFQKLPAGSETLARLARRAMQPSIDRRLPGGLSGTVDAVKEQWAETVGDFNRGLQWFRVVGKVLGVAKADFDRGMGYITSGGLRSDAKSAWGKNAYIHSWGQITGKWGDRDRVAGPVQDMMLYGRGAQRKHGFDWIPGGLNNPGLMSPRAAGQDTLLTNFIRAMGMAIYKLREAADADLKATRDRKYIVAEPAGF